MDHENLDLSGGNYEMRRSQLTDENVKGVTIIYGLKPHAARLPELV